VDHRNHNPPWWTRSVQDHHGLHSDISLMLLALQVAFVNSFRRVVRRRVHHGLDLGEGRERGAEASIVAVREARAKENHWSSWLGDEVVGGGGTILLGSLSVKLDQSALCQRGLGLSLSAEGGRRETRIGVWSNPVEGREDASHQWKTDKI